MNNNKKFEVYYKTHNKNAKTHQPRYFQTESTQGTTPQKPLTVILIQCLLRANKRFPLRYQETLQEHMYPWLLPAYHD